VKSRNWGYTLSRISTRSSASDGVSGGEASGNSLTRNVVETTKGISRGSTPSFTRSSAAVGGKSGEKPPRQQVMVALVETTHSVGPGLRQTCRSWTR